MTPSSQNCGDRTAVRYEADDASLADADSSLDFARAAAT